MCAELRKSDGEMAARVYELVRPKYLQIVVLRVAFNVLSPSFESIL